MQVEQELSRQTWLKAFGLSPWVASVRLAGAAPLPLLEHPDSRDAPAAPPQEPATDDARPTAAPATRQPVTPPEQQPAPAAVKAPEAPAPTSAAAPLLASRDQQPASSGQLPNPVLCLAGDTLLIAAQQDAGAPEMTTDEQHLLQALLQLFGPTSRRFPFPCPIDAEEAREALASFVRALSQQSCKRVLFCLEEDDGKHLVGELPRYQAFEFAGLPAVAISSIATMLATPVEHKRRSWQAIQAVGFDQPAT